MTSYHNQCLKRRETKGPNFQSKSLIQNLHPSSKKIILHIYFQHSPNITVASGPAGGVCRQVSYVNAKTIQRTPPGTYLALFAVVPGYQLAPLNKLTQSLSQPWIPGNQNPANNYTDLWGNWKEKQCPHWL